MAKTLKSTKTKTVKKTGYTVKGEKVSGLTLNLKAGSDHTLVAQWTHKKPSKTASYQYDWEYWSSKKNKWLPGNVGTTSLNEARIGTTSTYRYEFAAPEEAKQVRIRIMPISTSRNVVVSVTTTTKTYSDGSTSTSSKNNTASKPYYTGAWTAFATHDFRNDKLPTPTVEVEVDSLGQAVVTVECNDTDCEYMDVQLFRVTGWSVITVLGTNLPIPLTESKTWENVACPGGHGTLAISSTYIKRGEAISVVAKCSTAKNGYSKGDSDWSESATAKTLPDKPAGIKASALSSTSAKVTWDACLETDSYTVEYVADSASYFTENPAQVHSQDGIIGTVFTPTGLETGHTWYFRVKAVNEVGSGYWSAVASTVLATVPAAPTTYETDASYMLTDTPWLRWTHNSEDGSACTYWECAVNIIPPTGGSGTTTTLHGGGDGSPLGLNLASMGAVDGSTVRWRARTKGVHPDWSPWSAWREFKCYAQPTLLVSLHDANGNPLTSENPLAEYPFYAILDPAGGGNQPLSYHLVISAAEDTQYTDSFGTDMIIPAGYTVYEGDFVESDDPLTVAVTAGDALLHDGGSYNVTATVTMATGLTAASDASSLFVSFESDIPTPDALVVFDPDDLTAAVTPQCMEVDDNGDETGEYYGGVTLSVFRITSDGDLILLKDGIANDGTATVIDPHATFGECWYHIVATDSSTGVTVYADAMDESPHGTCVIQFDEQWQQQGPDGTVDSGPIYGGTVIDGLYNLEFGEDADPEGEDIAYIGRKNPVSYYGTQDGYTASYGMKFPRSDTETLAKLRRLQVLHDDCYIRESSGTGFWARTRVSLSRSHDGALWNATINATRNDRTDSALEG